MLLHLQQTRWKDDIDCATASWAWPHDPGPAVRHVDPLLSFSLSPCSNLSVHFLLSLLLYSLSCVPPSLIFPATSVFHPWLSLLVLPSSLLAVLLIAHIPAHPSLILICVTGYSWVNTILVQAPEAAFMYEEHLSSPLCLTYVQPVEWCWHFFCTVDSLILWTADCYDKVFSFFPFLSLSSFHESKAATRLDPKCNRSLLQNMLTTIINWGKNV